MRVLLLVVALVLGCGTLRKPPDPDRRLDVRASGAVFESDTGYKFAALPEPGSGVIRVTVRYPVGSADDPPGKEGLAHLVEHLLYEIEIPGEGAKTSIGAELARISLWSNASTSEDSTSYETLILPESLDTLVRLEVERLTVGCAGLNPAIVAREREVVLNELREKQGAQGADLMRQIHEAVFQAGHPYRAVSSVESVSKLTLEDVCGFLVGPYRRGKVIVVASGHVDPEALQTAAGHHLARAPKRDVTSARAAPPIAKPQPGTVNLRGDVEEPLLLATWPLPPMPSRDYRIVEMAMGAMPSRLEAFGLTYGWGHSAYSMLLGGAHAPVLAVAVTLGSAGDLDEAKSSARKAAEYAARTLGRTGDDRESPVWQARWRARAEAVLARWESLSTRNALAADIMQFESGERFIVGRVDELVKAHPNEAREIVKQWIDPSRARFLLIEPSANATIRTTAYSGDDEAHAVFVDAALADKPMPVLPARTTLRTERYKTANGISVVMWPHGNSPIVQGALIVDSGYAHEPAGKEGISSFVGADRIDEDGMIFADRQLSTQVDDLVASVSWELRAPGYEVEDEVKSVLKGQLRLARAKERTRYAREYLTALYGAKHPYARAAMTEDSLGKITHDSLMSWARSHIVPANSALVIAGKFDPALVKRYIAYNTDQVSSGSDSPDLAVEPTPKRGFISGVTDKPSPTVAIEVGFVGGSGIDRDQAKRLVLANVLDAQLAKLRAKRALTYGFGASYAPRRAGGLWSITGEVDATRAAEAATAITTILDELRASPESYRTAFVLGRQRALELLLVNTTSSTTVVAQLAELARYDLPDNFHELLARSVASMTLADFHPFLVRELAADGQVFGAFGNADAVSAAIRAAQSVQPAPAAARSKIVDPFE